MPNRVSLSALVICLCTTFTVLQAQDNVAINNTGNPPDSSAILDIQSTTKGILVPRMDSTQRTLISNAAPGLLVFDTDSESFWFRDSQGWTELVSTMRGMRDADQDTRVQVEATPDEDTIRFTIAGTELAKMDNKTFHLEAPGNSTFIGANAGTNDDGNDRRNTAVGFEALSSNISGTELTAVGQEALRSNTSSSYATAVGYKALTSNTTGAQVSALGWGALEKNTTGWNNSAFGMIALGNNTIGEKNTGIGSGALAANTTGSSNTALGETTMFSNTTGASNIALGKGALLTNTTGNNNVAVGFESLSSQTTVSEQTAVGYQALKSNTSSSYATAVGYKALTSNTTGAQVSALGWGALEKNTTGWNNSAFGMITLGNNTIGEKNTGIGSGALAANTTGSFNIALGETSMFMNTTGSNNSALGQRALFSSKMGSSNVGIGAGSNYFNENGSENTIIGFEAGYGVTTHSKSGNVHLGYRAGYQDTTDNKLYIANDSTLTPLIYGEFDNERVKVYGSLSASQGFTDMDGDTRIELEQMPDDDTIRFVVGGVEMALMDGKTMHLEAPGNSMFIGSNAGINDDGTSNFNTFVGLESGYSNLTGSQNIFLGRQSGYSNTSGGNNIFLGMQAGYSNINGSKNTVIGSGAGYSNASGSDNIFLGVGSGELNDNGDENTFVGTYSGKNNTSGDYNIAIGSEALYSNTTGDYNIAIGKSAMISNQDGTENTSIGAWTLSQSFTSVNNTAIGYSALTTNSSGQDNTAVGHNAMYSNALGDQNTAVGAKALYGNTTGSSNVAFGFETLMSNDEGTHNVAIGTETLEANTSGSSNTVVGSAAMNSNQSGGDNVGVGTGAMAKNTTGNRNVAIGHTALNYNDVGQNNVALGYQAGHGVLLSPTMSGNIFIGHKAGYNATGDNKLYIDNSSTSSPLIYGDFSANVAGINGSLGIGTQAPAHPLHVSKEGTDSVQTIVGILQSITSARPVLLFSENSTNGFASGMSIEYNGAAGFGDSNEMYINKAGGQSMVTFENSGEVGIGTTDPDTKLHIEGGTDSSPGGGGFLTLGSISGLNLSFDNNEIMARDNGSTADMYLQANGGRLGIGAVTFDSKVNIRSTTGENPLRARIEGATKFLVHNNGGTAIGVNTAPPADGLYVQGDILYNGALTSTSDGRYKKDIAMIDGALDAISAIDGVRYKWKRLEFPEKGFNDEPQIGFIAQNVEQQYPELVKTNPDGFKSVDYVKMIPVLVEAIKELERRNATLEIQVNALRSETEAMVSEKTSTIDLDGYLVHSETEGNSSVGAARIGSNVAVPACPAGCNGTVNTCSTTVLIGF